MDAELAYLFRHAVLRDAAYELQLPSSRARLHELAFYLIEETFGGRAPEPASLTTFPPPAHQPHVLDSVAFELSRHAKAAEAKLSAELVNLYLRRAAEYASREHHNERALALWLEIADLENGAAHAQALRRAADHLSGSGRPHEAEPLLLRALKIAQKDGPALLEFGALNDIAGV